MIVLEQIGEFCSVIFVYFILRSFPFPCLHSWNFLFRKAYKTVFVLKAKLLKDIYIYIYILRISRCILIQFHCILHYNLD